MPKISACIVAYCDYDEVCAAVRSILHYTPAPDLALYVVDNGSPDGCGRQLAETDFGDCLVLSLRYTLNSTSVYFCKICCIIKCKSNNYSIESVCCRNLHSKQIIWSEEHNKKL